MQFKGNFSFKYAEATVIVSEIKLSLHFSQTSYIDILKTSLLYVATLQVMYRQSIKHDIIVNTITASLYKMHQLNY